MSRYIDADELRDFLNGIQAELDFFSDEERPRYEAYAKALIILNERMENNPSIDIVRCKECRWLRYCETEDLDLYLDCDKPDGGGIPRNEDWFCADGEREGE